MTLPHSTRSPKLCWLVVVACATACTSPAAPRLDEVDRDLAEIRLNVVEGGPGRPDFLEVYARPSDHTRRLGQHERIAVELTTNAGDREELLVGPHRCESPGGVVDCNRFIVSMEPGASTGLIQGAVESLDAHLVRTGICSGFTGVCHSIPSLGRVVVFDTHRLDEVMERVARLPHVQYVERIAIGQLMSLGQTIHALYYAPVRLRRDGVVVGDGSLQLPPSGSVAITASHPTASTSIELEGGD